MHSSKSAAVKAAVIIPAYNYPDRLDQLLTALSKQTAPCSWKTIVVDDGSAQALKSVTDKYPSVVYLRQERSGPSAARNRGALAVDAQILVFIDQDCLPRPQWLSAMLEPFDRPDVLGAKGVYQTRQKNVVAKFVQAEYEEKYEILNKYELINFVDSYSAAFRAADYWACGGFDPRFTLPSVEDREMSLRLSQGKARFAFCRKAEVTHLHTDSIGGYIRKKFKYGYWGYRIAAKYPKLFLRDNHTPRSQRFQTGLIFLLPMLLILAFFGNPWPLWTAIVMFGVSSVPLTASAFKKGVAVGGVAPLLIFLRATAVGIGLCCGAVANQLPCLSAGKAVGDAENQPDTLISQKEMKRYVASSNNR